MAADDSDDDDNDVEEGSGDDVLEDAMDAVGGRHARKIREVMQRHEEEQRQVEHARAAWLAGLTEHVEKEQEPGG